MTTYDAGSARATYELDLAPLRRSVAEAKQLMLELRQAQQQAQQAPAPGTQTVVPRREAPNAIPVGGGRGVDPAAQAQRAEAALLRQARAEASLMVAEGNRAGAEQRLRQALQGANQDTIAAIQTRTQLARVSAPDAGPFGRLREGIQGVTSALGALGIGFGVLSTGQALVQSFADAFKFKAELDASAASVNVLLQGVRNVPAVYAAANAYAQQYKLTQEELSGALVAASQIMRQSTAPTEQILNVMQRLTVLNPKENIEGAAFSIKELASGDITSIAERFNVSRKAANAMKQEILAGGDAVKILDSYLASVGVTSDALAAKLGGPVGKMKDLAIAQEQLKIAQGEFATGPGMKILEEQIYGVRIATKALTGDTYELSQLLTAGLQGGPVNAALRAGQAIAQQSAATRDNTAATAQAGQAANAATGEIIAQAQATTAVTQATTDAIAKQADAIAADQEMAGYKQELAYLSQQVASGLMSSGQAALIMARDYGIAAGQAAALVAQQAALANMPVEARAERNSGSDLADVRRLANANRDAANAQAEADQRAGERSGGRAANVNEETANAQRAQSQARTAAEVEKARQEQIIATGDATAVVAQRQRAYNDAVAQYGANSAQAVRAQTDLIQAQQQAASAGAKAAKAGAKDAKADAKAYEAEYEAARDAAQKIEQLQADHYDKLQRLQEDYLLSSSRDREDFEVAKQRLLAEGRIKEAQLLEEDFNRKAKREAEDNAVARRRETEQAAQGIAEAQAKAAQDARDRAVARQINGQALPGDAAAAAQAAGASAATAPATRAGVASGARQAQAEAVLAATAAQRPTPVQVNVQVQPASVQIDGQTIVTFTWPLISQLVDADLAAGVAQVAISAPPGAGQGSGVGGPTP